jgi:hypothetical protein
MLTHGKKAIETIVVEPRASRPASVTKQLVPLSAIIGNIK